MTRARVLLPQHRGVMPGDRVHVIGWRHPGSVDVRTVVCLWREPCEGGVMVELDRPLHNQTSEACVSLAWTREGGARA